MDRIINSWRMSHSNLMEANGCWTTAKTAPFFSFLKYVLSNCYVPGSTVRTGDLRGKLARQLPRHHAADVLVSGGPAEPVLCGRTVPSSWDILTFHSQNKSLKLGPLSRTGFSWLDSATPGGWGYWCTQPPAWTGLLHCNWNHHHPQEALEAVPRALVPSQPQVSASLMLTPCPGREHPVGSAHKPISWVLRFRTNIWHPPCMAAGECIWKWKIKSESYMLIQKDHKKVWFIYKVPTSRIKHVYLRPEGGKG